MGRKRVSSYKRRKPGGTYKTVKVKSHYRGVKKVTIKYPKRKTRKK